MGFQIRKRRRHHGQRNCNNMSSATSTTKFLSFLLLIILTNNKTVARSDKNDTDQDGCHRYRHKQDRLNFVEGRSLTTHANDDILICRIIPQSTIHSRKHNIFDASTLLVSPSWVEDTIALCAPIIDGFEIDDTYVINLPDAILSGTAASANHGLYVAVPNGQITNDSVIGFDSDDIYILDDGSSNYDDRGRNLLFRERSARPGRPEQGTLPILSLAIPEKQQQVLPSGGPIIPLSSSNIETRSILILRVSLQDSKPTITSQQIYDSIFGYDDGITVQSQYNQCSSGKLQFKPAPFGNIIGLPDGILDVNLSNNFTSDYKSHNVPIISLANAAQDEASKILGLETIPTNDNNSNNNHEHLSSIADHVMICLPPGIDRGGDDDNWIASASVDHWRSIYNDHYCGVLSTTMHEIGHNLGLYHANYNGDYKDYTSYMSAGVNQRRYPQKCFNGQNNYLFGWFGDRTLRLTASDIAENNEDGFDRQVTLASFVDYNKLLTATPALSNTMDVDIDDIVVLISIDEKYFLQFNVAKGPNVQTEDMIDQVTIVEDRSGGTELLGGIDIHNPTYRIEGFFNSNDSSGQSDLVIMVCGQSISPRGNSPTFVDFANLTISRGIGRCPTLPPSTSPTPSPSNSPSKNPTIDPNVVDLGEALGLLLAEAENEIDTKARGTTAGATKTHNNVEPPDFQLRSSSGGSSSSSSVATTLSTSTTTIVSNDVSDLRTRSSPTKLYRPRGITGIAIHNNVGGFAGNADIREQSRPRGVGSREPISTQSRIEFQATLLRGSTNGGSGIGVSPESRPRPSSSSRPKRRPGRTGEESKRLGGGGGQRNNNNIFLRRGNS